MCADPSHGTRTPPSPPSLTLAYRWPSQGNYTEADSVFLRAIDIGEKKLGDHHPSLAMWLNNRAELLQQQVRAHSPYPPSSPDGRKERE